MRPSFASRAAAAFLLTVAMVAASLPGVATASEPLRAGTFDPPRDAPDFTLRGSGGADLHLASYRGKVVILAFGFTSCPVICPTTLATLAAAHKALGDDAKDVQVVYVTVDPERDTVEKLKPFLAAFDPSFVGATGTEEELAAVRKEYGVDAKKVAAGDSYAYVHSSYTYFVDKAGKLVALMPYGHTADDYVHDARVLLGR
jgi:protein SCO1/2